MQIGRRIYFDRFTGNIIQDMGEREGSVYVTSNAEDFATYPSLQGIILADTDYLELDFGVRSTEFQNLGSYHVDVATRELIIYPHLTFTQDKVQITGNGIDTLTITVTTSNAVADTISFTVDGVTQAVPTTAGQAVFRMTSSVVGTYTINMTSTTYGGSSTTIEVV